MHEVAWGIKPHTSVNQEDAAVEEEELDDAEIEEDEEAVCTFSDSPGPLHVDHQLRAPTVSVAPHCAACCAVGAFSRRLSGCRCHAKPLRSAMYRQSPVDELIVLTRQPRIDCTLTAWLWIMFCLILGIQLIMS